MSIVVRFKPTSLTAEVYDEATRQLEEAIEYSSPPEIFEVHEIVKR